MDKTSSRTGWGILGVPQGSCLGSREGDWPSLHEATLLLLVLDSPFLCPTKVVTSDSTQGWRVIPTEVLGETPPPVEYPRFPVPGSPTPPFLCLHNAYPSGPPPLCSLSLHTRSRSRCRLLRRASHTQ